MERQAKVQNYGGGNGTPAKYGRNMAEAMEQQAKKQKCDGGKRGKKDEILPRELNTWQKARDMQQQWNTRSKICCCKTKYQVRQQYYNLSPWYTGQKKYDRSQWNRNLNLA